MHMRNIYGCSWLFGVIIRGVKNGVNEPIFICKFYALERTEKVLHTSLAGLKNAPTQKFLTNTLMPLTHAPEHMHGTKTANNIWSVRVKAGLRWLWYYLKLLTNKTKMHAWR